MKSSNNFDRGSQSARHPLSGKLQILLIVSLVPAAIGMSIGGRTERGAAVAASTRAAEAGALTVSSDVPDNKILLAQKSPDKNEKDKPEPKDKADKPADKAADKTPPKPEVVLENVQAVNPDDLVAKPHDYVGKNVKFTASFSAFNNLALDYKPAFRSSKTHLSFLVHKPKTHLPLSELKLAMAIPKEKDPETQLLATLKDGEQIELTGKVFAAALDDPWVEVFKIRKLNADKDDKKADASSDKKNEKSSADSKSDKGAAGKPDTDTKDKPKAPAKN